MGDECMEKEMEGQESRRGSHTMGFRNHCVYVLRVCVCVCVCVCTDAVQVFYIVVSICYHRFVLE